MELDLGLWRFFLSFFLLSFPPHDGIKRACQMVLVDCTRTRVWYRYSSIDTVYSSEMGRDGWNVWDEGSEGDRWLRFWAWYSTGTVPYCPACPSAWAVYINRPQHPKGAQGIAGDPAVTMLLPPDEDTIIYHSNQLRGGQEPQPPTDKPAIAHARTAPLTLQASQEFANT
ncbi:hypothetical protein HOY82DRAFT_593253 [Tuber indicum]|nr:hypothetical protein HOY82DRAFT_593253 [Tuber indicum]